jgi:hypothetical protein
MSFFFEDTNPDWRCKECGTAITLDQYQRMQYCDFCQDAYDILTHGCVQRHKKTEAEIDHIVANECYDGWEVDFSARLNEWSDKRRRLR